MKIFVTGATGYVGNAVACALRRSGHDVIGLVRSEEKAKRLWTDELRPVVGDLKKPESFADAVREADAVVHCGGEMSIFFADLDRQSVDRLLALLREGDRPRAFIYSSGVWVYGDTQGRVANESSPVRPLGLVGWRPAVEESVLHASTDRLSTSVVRLGCVYGGRYRPPYRHGALVNHWFESAEKDGTARITGDGQNRWAMIHVDDAAELYARIIGAREAAKGQIYNAVDPSRNTVREMAAAALEASGKKGELRAMNLAEATRQLGPFAEAMVADQQIDGTKGEAIGWKPRFRGFIENAAHAWQAWRNRSA